jgi:hypothetical protein
MRGSGLAATGVGALSGLAIGHIAPGATSRKRAQQRDAAVFGSVGHVLWALLDIRFFAYGRPSGSIAFATLAPTFAGIASSGGMRADGAELLVASAF